MNINLENILDKYLAFQDLIINSEAKTESEIWEIIEQFIRKNRLFNLDEYSQLSDEVKNYFYCSIDSLNKIILDCITFDDALKKNWMQFNYWIRVTISEIESFNIDYYSLDRINIENVIKNIIDKLDMIEQESLIFNTKRNKRWLKNKSEPNFDPLKFISTTSFKTSPFLKNKDNMKIYDNWMKSFRNSFTHHSQVITTLLYGIDLNEVNAGRWYIFELFIAVSYYFLVLIEYLGVRIENKEQG